MVEEQVRQYSADRNKMLLSQKAARSISDLDSTNGALLGPGVLEKCLGLSF